MEMHVALALFAACTAGVVSAQTQPASLPSSGFPRGASFQSWQNPGLKNVLAKCKNPPQPFSIPGAGQSANANAAPDGSGPSSHGRNSRRARLRAVVEARLVVRRQ